MTEVIEYFDLWYPLPAILPYDVRIIIFDYVFDPLADPW